jgi:hypothetical protein
MLLSIPWSSHSKAEVAILLKQTPPPFSVEYKSINQKNETGLATQDYESTNFELSVLLGYGTYIKVHNKRNEPLPLVRGEVVALNLF